MNISHQNEILMFLACRSVCLVTLLFGISRLFRILDWSIGSGLARHAYRLAQGLIDFPVKSMKNKLASGCGPHYHGRYVFGLNTCHPAVAIPAK